jgi:signal transduction histidine kinase
MNESAAAPLRLLLVEDSVLDYEMTIAVVAYDPLFERTSVATERVEDEAGMRAALRGEPVHAVITDHNLPRFDSFAALRVAREHDADLPVVVLSGDMSDELAVAALHAGADDFVLKSRMFRLPLAVRRALDTAAGRRAQRAAVAALAASEARLRDLTLHLEAVKEQERRAIAQEIHDDVGSTLTALKFELARLARLVPAGVPAHAHIESMNELLTHAVAASHRIQHNLHPAVLDAGLVDALQWLARGFEQRTGLQTSFESNREHIELAIEPAVALYRAAQEALANISRHAHARHVSMSLFAAPEEVTLEVVDDGGGFDPAMLAHAPGFGVRSIVERARGLGGWAEVHSQPGRGATLMFGVPTRAGAPAPRTLGPATAV